MYSLYEDPQILLWDSEAEVTTRRNILITDPNVLQFLTTIDLFAISREFLAGDWDFGDKGSRSSPWFVDSRLRGGGPVCELHIPVVRRLPLLHGLEILLPVLSGRSLHVSQVESVEKLPYHPQSISGSWCTCS